MKTLITTFAFALMVFAFNVNPAMANAGTDTKHTLWAAAESPVDVFGENEEVTEIDESDFAQREPECRWKWQTDPNTGNLGWVCQYYNEGEVPGDNVAWDTEPSENLYCWQSVGSSGPVTVCARDDSKWFNEEGDGGEQFAGFLDYCRKHGNCMMYEDKDQDGILESAGKYHDSKTLNLDRDRNDWNKHIKSFAYGCRTRPDGAVVCPGDAWNTDENAQKDFAYRLESWCDKNPHLRKAFCDNAGVEWIKKQFAQSQINKLLQKQQQDEEDWNAWILRQFAVYEELLDSESLDGFGGRNVADSGDEGSTSAAGANEQ